MRFFSSITLSLVDHCVLDPQHCLPLFFEVDQHIKYFSLRDLADAAYLPCALLCVSSMCVIALGIWALCALQLYLFLTTRSDSFKLPHSLCSISTPDSAFSFSYNAPRMPVTNKKRTITGSQITHNDKLYREKNYNQRSEETLVYTAGIC